MPRSKKLRIIGLLGLVLSLSALVAGLSVANAKGGNSFFAMLQTGGPTLGNYSATSVQLSGDATITPTVAPTSAFRITVSTSTNFKGKLEADPTTGVVRITDAHPAGTYTITVRAFDSSGLSTTKTFTLTVTTPTTCNPVSFAAAAGYGVGSIPRSVTVGDFNGDGIQDLAVANVASFDLSILLGNGSGGFTPTANPVATGNNPELVVVGDFDGDGKQDLATANYGSNTVSILKGDGTGGFTSIHIPTVLSNPYSLAVGDFNNDGKQDLVTANFSSGNVAVLIGDGTGDFSPATYINTGANPQSVVVGDFDNNGNQDIAVANAGSSTVSILTGNGTGNFTVTNTLSVGTDPYLIVLGDFNNDGFQDLATANNGSNSVSVLFNNGTGSFNPASTVSAGSNPASLAVGDFDGNGIQDLAVANGSSNNVLILLSDGNGGFNPVNPAFNVEANPASIAVGDFNGDGKQDLAVANQNSGSASVLLRQCPPPPPLTCTPPPANMVAWYPGDGNADDIQGGNNGALKGGAGFAPGKVAQAFNLNGSGQYIRVPSSTALNPTGSFSIDAWIFPTADVGSDIVAKWGDSGDYFNQRAYIFTFGPNGQLGFGISDAAHQGDGSFQGFSTPSNAVRLNAWNHVAAVYDQSTGTRLIYVDGVQVASRTDAPITITNSIADVGIGAQQSSSTVAAGFFPGEIDEVEIFNRALSQTEIQSIVNADSAGKCKPQTLTVTNTLDSGTGSLRDAITSANAFSGKTNINFNISGTVVQTISLLSPLPTITKSVTIDGYTQSGSSANTVPDGDNAVLLIELDGTNAGTGADGLVFTPAAGSIVRGLVINRFDGAGISIAQPGGITVEGNFIGTNAAGTAVLRNGGDGIRTFSESGNNVIGGTTASARNIISGNSNGINIQSNSNTVQGNFIGTGIDGTTDLRNTVAGVSITNGYNNVIGNSVQDIGSGLSAGNIIAYNGVSSATGVHVHSGTGNTILSNSIFSNDGLGIDLNDDFVTANDQGDADTGANNLQNYPVLTSAITDGSSSTTVQGILNSTPGHTFIVQVFDSPSCDSSGNGEGQVLQATTTPITTDGNGYAPFSANLPAFAPGQSITATATDTATGDTSEFSPCQFVTSGGGTTTTYTLFGHIVDGQAGGAGVQGVNVDLFDNSTTTFIGSVLTNADGNYTFSNLTPGDSYTVTPSQTGYTFSPPSQTFSIYSDVTASDFVRIPSHTISGHITDANSIGISGVTVNLISQQASAAPAITDANGFYSFTDLQDGGTYTIDPSKVGFYFTPSFLTYTKLTSDVTNADFTGTLAGTSPGRIVFKRSAPDSPTALYIVNPDGSNPVAVNNTNYASDPAWSPDGTKLVFIISSSPANTPGIYTINTDGTNLTQLTNDINDGEPSWSPDGSKIAFERLAVINGISSRNIFVMNADGSNQTDITNISNDREYSPTWSPDSAKIAYSYYNNSDVRGIAVINADGSNQKALTTDSGFSPDWSPDGTKIAYSNYLYNGNSSSYAIIVMNADGSNPVNITQNYPGLLENPSWSPDNARLATEGDRGLFVIKAADGSERTRLTDGYDSQPAWQHYVAGSSGGGGTPTTFTVANTNDSGTGSLRQAILDANANSGVTDTISFAIDRSGVQTIALASALPDITDPVIIDGYTQPGASANSLAVGDDAVLLIELDCTNASAGLNITAGNSTVRGLVINHILGSGISISTNGGNTIAGNFIGINAAGTAGVSSGSANTNRKGIIIDGSPNNVIGGTAPADRNVISGNQTNLGTSTGVYIQSAGSTGNLVQGNYVGTDKNGTASLGNYGAGVFLDTSSSNNTIGGTASGAGNLISGNADWGVLLLRTTNNAIQGNLIGTNATGTAAIPNTVSGVGIEVQSTNNIVGGTTAAARNVISGNNGSGIEILDNGTTGNVVSGNYIGVAADGTTALGNTGTAGIGSPSSGIEIYANASNNTVGGTTPDAANVIAFNAGNGVNVAFNATGASIIGNSIHDNARLGIDLGNDGVTANDAGDADTGANNLQNYPVLTSASFSNNIITIQGTLNSTPNTTFRVEFFGNPSCDNSGYGEGQFTRGVLNNVTTDGNGNASFTAQESVISGGGVITATATDPNGNTSEFSPCQQITAALPTVDVQLTKGDAPDPVTVGSQLTYTLQATNGPAPSGTPSATNVIVSDPLPAGVTYNSVTTTQGTCLQSNGTVTCNLGTLGVNGSATVTILVTPNTAGTITNTATITTDNPDSNTANNSATATTTVQSSPFTVTNTNDSGTGSLRQAILTANSTAGTQTINFNIPVPSGSPPPPPPYTITPVTPLPTITDPVIIDGTTQPGYAGTPIIELNGASAGTGANGLFITAGNSTVRGLVINRFNGSGISLQTNGGNTITGCYIGTNSAGTAAAANAQNGITVSSANNIIGGTVAGARNLLSGNGNTGVQITNSANGNGNVVQGNLIGTDATGTASVKNTNNGVQIFFAGTNNLIGGTSAGARNIVSGNGLNGVAIQSSSGNTVQGNYIGTNLNGDTRLPNSVQGVNIGTGNNNLIGGTTAGAGNLISGNNSVGVGINNANTVGNKVQGNLIGTNAAGTAALTNSQGGISIAFSVDGTIIGGDDAADGTVDGIVAARNIISGNGSGGLSIQQATNTTVQGNYIGTDLAGTAALPNAGGGVNLSGGATNNTIGGITAGARNLISGNSSNGININNTGTTGNRVQGNYIGTKADGASALANTGAGVAINGAATNTVGGTTAGAGNVISGNGSDGVQLVNTGTTGNIVQGNLLGTDATGTVAIPNVFRGVSIFNSASGNTVGGTTASARNIISGNTQDGVFISISASNNTVQGNYIGLQINGSAALANAANGIIIAQASTNNLVGGTATGAGNVISGNKSDGIRITGTGTSGNTVQGNLLGTNAAGTAAVTNTFNGVRLDNFASNNTIGGTVAGARNVLSGNTVNGVLLQTGASTNTVQGNYIGTDITGAVAVPNVFSGVNVFGPSSNGNIIGGAGASARNVISGNSGRGIILQSSALNNVIKGNYIGVAADGTSALGNTTTSGSGITVISASNNNVIGGTLAGEGNVISGNARHGVVIQQSSNNMVQGNYVGTNATGASALPNSAVGVLIVSSSTTSDTTNNLIGGTSAGAGNVISGNGSDGVQINSGVAATNNLVQGNFIGTNAGGNAALPNARVGVALFSLNNTVGGTTAGASNIIAFNTGGGVYVDPIANGNRIQSNSIYSNAQLGIDLGGDGVTPNDTGDADTGANNLQNYPVLTSVTYVGGSANVQGTFNSAASATYQLEFFSNPTCDPSGYGQGKTYLGGQSVTTDASGNATFSLTLANAPAGQPITTTATDAKGNTSEFSACRSTAAPPPTYSISGRVTDSNGAGLSGTSVALSDGQTNFAPALTDANGNYSFTGLAAGATYTLNPSKAGLQFTPLSLTFSNLSADQTGANFTGAPIPPTGFTIAGRVTDANSNNTNGISGVTVTLSGSQTATVTTDSSGNYSFANLAAGGNYTVTVAKTNFDFSPTSRTFNNLQSDQTASYAGVVANLFVSGLITDTAGKPIPDVDVVLSGAGAEAVRTDAAGNYAFSSIAAGKNYTVTPSKTNYTFAPANRVLSNFSGNATLNFVGTFNPNAPTFDPSESFSGNQIDPTKFSLGTLSTGAASFDPLVSVVQANGTLQITPRTGVDTESFNGYVSVRGIDLTIVPTVGVEVVQPASGDGAQTIFGVGNDSDNFYRFVVSNNASDIVNIDGKNRAQAKDAGSSTQTLTFQSSLTGTKFATNIPYNPVAHRFWRLRFEATLPKMFFETSPDSKVWTVQFSSDISKSVTSLVAEISAGTVKATANVGTAIFDNYGLAAPVGVQFASPSYSIVENGGNANITVIRTGNTESAATVNYATSDGTAKAGSDYTATSGALRFAAGETSKSFNIPIINDSISEPDETVNLTLNNPVGTALGNSTAVLTIIDDDNRLTNPADDARFFVRQQYLDFLNREPDTDGLNYWMGRIAECGTDTRCVTTRRVEVSAAFFLSQEFKDTGSFVYLVYKAAFGARPTFAQFMTDRARIIGGGNLDASKQSFASDFTSRADFKNKYDSLTDAQYVDALYANAGVKPSSEERAALVAGLLTKRETRASVLQQVVANQEFASKELNPSFVLMEYFGYLRRDPDEAGYQFWLGVLNNKVPGNYRAMVCAFISSAEYQFRFGSVRTRTDGDCAQ